MARFNIVRDLFVFGDKTMIIIKSTDEVFKIFPIKLSMVYLEPEDNTC